LDGSNAVGSTSNHHVYLISLEDKIKTFATSRDIAILFKTFCSNYFEDFCIRGFVTLSKGHL